jgi:hypothetical protein
MVCSVNATRLLVFFEDLRMLPALINKQARGKLTRWLEFRLWSVCPDRRITASQELHIPLFVNIIFIQI